MFREKVRVRHSIMVVKAKVTGLENRCVKKKWRRTLLWEHYRGSFEHFLTCFFQPNSTSSTWNAITELYRRTAGSKGPTCWNPYWCDPVKSWSYFWHSVSQGQDLVEKTETHNLNKTLYYSILTVSWVLWFYMFALQTKKSGPKPIHTKATNNRSSLSLRDMETKQSARGLENSCHPSQPSF